MDMNRTEDKIPQNWEDESDVDSELMTGDTTHDQQNDETYIDMNTSVDVIQVLGQKSTSTNTNDEENTDTPSPHELNTSMDIVGAIKGKTKTEYLGPEQTSNIRILTQKEKDERNKKRRQKEKRKTTVTITQSMNKMTRTKYTSTSTHKIHN